MGRPRKQPARLDIAEPNGDNAKSRMRAFPNDGFQLRKDNAMGDKGGKKDKEKDKKQKVSKQEQSAKGKQDKNRPK